MEIIDDAECENFLINNVSSTSKNGEKTVSNKILRDKLNTEKSENGEKETPITMSAGKNGLISNNESLVLF